jgi:hypothetical protein
MLGFVMAMLLLGFLNKKEASRTEVLEGIVDWGGLQPGFYPSGDCTQRYEYFSSKDSSADLNARRTQTGNPNAMRVKIRGRMSVSGSDGHTGATYRRELMSREIIDAKPVRGCLI